MSELPDIQIYLGRLEAHAGGKTLTGVRIPGPFLLRTVQSAPQEAIGRKIVGFRRIGKRIVFKMEEDLFLALHLMIVVDRGRCFKLRRVQPRSWLEGPPALAGRIRETPAVSSNVGACGS